MCVVDIREDRLVFSLTQQVDTVHGPVMIDQVQKVLVKRRLARCLRSSDLKFLTKRLVSDLFPKEGHTSSDLKETHHDVVHGEDGLGFDKVGDVAIIVDASGSEPRSGTFPSEPTDQSETGLLLLIPGKARR